MGKSIIDCIIIDDEVCGCERLKDLLGSFQQINVIGTCSTYKEALDLILEKKPTLLFLDVELDRHHTAFELIDQVYAHLFKPYIILVTAYNHYSIKAIKKEVFDYLVKPVDVDELKETISRLENHMISPLHSMNGELSPLSAREKQVLELILEGKTSKEIAETLFVSKSTIDTHRKNILKKTGAKSVMDLMRLTRN